MKLEDLNSHVMTFIFGVHCQILGMRTSFSHSLCCGTAVISGSSADTMESPLYVTVRCILSHSMGPFSGAPNIPLLRTCTDNGHANSNALLCVHAPACMLACLVRGGM